MTTPLFLLRCVQLGISIRDLDLLTIGMVNDMYAESSNDEYKGYAQIATQRDFDAFRRYSKGDYSNSGLSYPYCMPVCIISDSQWHRTGRAAC